VITAGPEPSGHESFDAFWRSLLVADWENPQGPIRLSAKVGTADLTDSTFLHNTRIFLSALVEGGGVATTSAGRLNRKFVAQMFEQFRLSAPHRESMVKVCKVINEQDLWPLHLVRIVSECGGLVARRKKQFRVTGSGRRLLSDSQAGGLFRKLFLTYFRKFDLHYDFFLRDVPGIQQTLAVTLWRLDTVARDWMPVRGLALDILLPGVLVQLHRAMTTQYDKEEWILSGYVLKPLLDLGLIEKQHTGDWSGIGDEDRIRVTGLWRKFISFASIQRCSAAFPA
jgi:hypothetical protein